MSQAPGASPYEPFFLDADPGRRFCVYFPPSGAACRATVLHVPAFGEEMNKSRRMVARQARTLAGLGVGVLLVDLYGCGDSDGDFADARWDIWKEDLAGAVSWLRRRESAPVGLWGHRLGALLMMDFAMAAAEVVHTIVLWQPVVNGEAYLTQFLRLRVANEMIAGSQAKVGTKALKEALKGGERLEVAGYALDPGLALPLDEARLADFAVPGAVCHWLEVQAGEGGVISPASRRVIDRWAESGVRTEAEVVQGEPFWTTQEITDCPPLIAATDRIFAEFAP